MHARTMMSCSLLWLLLALPAAQSSLLQVLLDATVGDAISVCRLVEYGYAVYGCKINDPAFTSYLDTLSPALAKYCKDQAGCESDRCRAFSTPSQPSDDEIQHNLCLPVLGHQVDQDAYDSWNNYCSNYGVGSCHNETASAGLAKMKGIPDYVQTAPVPSPSPSPSPPPEPPASPSIGGDEREVGRCKGTPDSCSSRPASSCSGGGCHQSCPLRPSAAGGLRTDTCYCSGSASSCSAFDSAGSCNRQRGCHWHTEGETVPAPPPPNGAAAARASTTVAFVAAMLAVML